VAILIQEGKNIVELSIPNSLSSEIARSLEGAVISGELGPGEVYSARHLAEKFGVSATPVREALLALTNEGLLEPVRNRGFRVVRPTDEELDNLLELRRLIEIPTARKAAQVGTDEQTLRQLRELAKTIEIAATERDFVTLCRVDIEFHCLQMSIAGNPQLVAAVRSFRVRSRLYGIAEVIGDNPAEEMNEALTRDHSRMVDLIEARDADAAEQLMAGHLSHVRKSWA
jgi:DNA-binding GntR family transcriptional regulator